MALFLSNADVGDTTGYSNIILLLVCAGLVCLVCFLAVFPVVIARGRNHRQYDSIKAVTILWALIAAGTAIYAAISQMNWQKEHLVRIESGYGDTTVPNQPWLVWMILVFAYVVLILWSRVRPPVSAENGPSKPE